MACEQKTQSDGQREKRGEVDLLFLYDVKKKKQNKPAVINTLADNSRSDCSSTLNTQGVTAV